MQNSQLIKCSVNLFSWNFCSTTLIKVEIIICRLIRPN